MKSHPTLFGIPIGLVGGGLILFVTIRFPQFIESLSVHKTLLQAFFFTGFAFGAWLYGMWRWRHRRAFWPSVGIFLVLHGLGVFFYTAIFGRILVWQWLVALMLEAYLIAFFVSWSTQRFGQRLKRH